MPGVGFTWRRRSGGLLRLEARHEVLGAGAMTISRLEIVGSGPLSVLLWPVLWVVFSLALGWENAALKARCEAPSVPG